MMNAFGQAIAALGVGVIAVGHWSWAHMNQLHPPRGQMWQVELYTGIFLIGVGVHALAAWYWFDQLGSSAASVRDPN